MLTSGFPYMHQRITVLLASIGLALLTGLPAAHAQGKITRSFSPSYGTGSGAVFGAPGAVYGNGTIYGGGSVYGGGNVYGGGVYPNYNGRPLGSFGNIGNPYGAGLYNNPYYGSYGPIGAPVGSVYGAPVALPGGYFRIGKVGVQYWQSPSGYYYPWGVGAIGVPQQVYYVQQGSTTQAKPPLPTELNDMEKYLEENKAKDRIADSDYQHLFRRVHDLRSKYNRLAGEFDGVLDPGDEEHLRRDIDQCAAEISQRVRPAPSTAANAANTNSKSPSSNPTSSTSSSGSR